MANGGNRLTTYPSTAHPGNIGEQATPTDPGNTQKRTQNHIVSVEYASHMMVPSASRNKISWTISKIIRMKQSGFKAENGCNPRE